jgi:hypothetical protein
MLRFDQSDKEKRLRVTAPRTEDKGARIKDEE